MHIIWSLIDFFDFDFIFLLNCYLLVHLVEPFELFGFKFFAHLCPQLFRLMSILFVLGTLINLDGFSELFVERLVTSIECWWNIILFSILQPSLYFVFDLIYQILFILVNHLTMLIFQIIYSIITISNTIVNNLACLILIFIGQLLYTILGLFICTVQKKNIHIVTTFHLFLIPQNIPTLQIQIIQLYIVRNFVPILDDSVELLSCSVLIISLCLWLFIGLGFPISHQPVYILDIADIQ